MRTEQVLSDFYDPTNVYGHGQRIEKILTCGICGFNINKNDFADENRDE